MENEKLLCGHRVVVEGIYFARPLRREDDHTGKRKVSYREEFLLDPAEHRSHAQGALGHVLSDKLLAKRLTAKDPEFRGISTHEVTEHENLFEAPKAAALAPSKV